MASGGDHTTSFIELTANIVSAYVSNNPVPAADIPTLINQIHSALMQVSAGRADVAAEPLRPAVGIKKINHPGSSRLSGGRQEVQVPAASFAQPVQYDPGTIPRKMGAAAGLSDGRAELRGRTLPTRQADGSRATAPAPREIIACVGNRQACASAARASDRMRSTIDRNPFERCGVRCSRRPICSNSATASVARMLRAGLPE